MKVRNRGWTAPVLLAAAVAASALACVAAFSGLGAASAQSDDDAVFRVVPPEGDIKEGGEPVPVDVVVENIENMASFSFDLKYNADIFEFASYERGDFLSSSGREVICNEPVADAGVVRITCATLREAPLGPDGGGKLATVFLTPKGSGSTELTLDGVRANPVEANDPNEIPPRLEEIPLQTAGAPVEVSGTGGQNWLLWGIIIVGGIAVVAAVAFGAMRMRGRSETPAAAT